MTEQKNLAFAQEWQILQTQYEVYEKSCLNIKLLCIASYVVIWAFNFLPALAAILMLIFWLQEAITRTSQARMGDRILQVEHLLESDDDTSTEMPFQLHSKWLKSRPSSIGLLQEYFKNALRPTVAFPYIVLLVLHGIEYLHNPVAM